MKCIRCGNCCRRGGKCILRSWRSREAWLAQDMEFEGECSELLPDGRCGIIVKAQSGELNVSEEGLKFLDSYLRGICDAPPGIRRTGAFGGNSSDDAGHKFQRDNDDENDNAAKT